MIRIGDSLSCEIHRRIDQMFRNIVGDDLAGRDVLPRSEIGKVVFSQLELSAERWLVLSCFSDRSERDVEYEDHHLLLNHRHVRTVIVRLLHMEAPNLTVNNSQVSDSLLSFRLWLSEQVDVARESLVVESQSPD